MYRVELCRVGWLRHSASLIGMLCAVVRVLQINALAERVLECECKDLGEDRQM